MGDVLSSELSTSFGVDDPGQLLPTITVGADPTPLRQEGLASVESIVDII